MRTGIAKRLFCAAAVGILTAGITGTSLAADKAISSVSIRVGLGQEAGDQLPDSPSIYNEGETPEDSTYVSVSNEKYTIREAEWVSGADRVLAVGDRPRLRVYLEASGYPAGDDSEYVFRGTYSSGNVTVKGGTFVSARKNGTDELEVVIAFSGVKGQYEVPASAEWRDSGYGKAVWNRENSYDDDYTRAISSGYYDVYLYRGNTVVKKLEAYHGTSYDFYPYMTTKGTYYYKVRSVPYTEEQKKYGKKSGWLESDEIYIDQQHVSDGRGQTDGNGVNTGTDRVGWIPSGGTWYYRYPDGSYQKDSWLQLGGTWYLFDAEGRMMTGWQVKNGRTYYLQDNGAMLTGWVKAGNLWYYLNSLADGGVEGAMRTGWLNKDGKVYYLNSSGAMAEGWNQVEGNWYYFYPGSGNRAVSTYIDGFWVNEEGIWRK